MNIIFLSIALTPAIILGIVGFLFLPKFAVILSIIGLLAGSFIVGVVTR